MNTSEIYIGEKYVPLAQSLSEPNSKTELNFLVLVMIVTEFPPRRTTGDFFFFFGVILSTATFYPFPFPFSFSFRAMAIVI